MHRRGHGIHSPFVYDLLTNVIENDNQYYIFADIENLRNQLLRSKQKMIVSDLGAGSALKNTRERSIKKIVKHSAKNRKYGQLLFRLVHHFKPEILLELGTSLGFSSAYLAAPDKDSILHTIEGCNNLARYAMHNFSLLKLENIKSYNAPFEEALPKILNKIKVLDFAFFDGNHRKEPTLNYFNQCLGKINSNSVFIFDDIHWSAEMEEAWEEIKKHPQVVVTIDLFFLGLVFFRKELSKQDFVIRF